MRSVFKYTGIGILVTFFIVIAYYSYLVFEARRYTQRTVLEDIKNSQWRPPNGEPKVFDIKSNELSDRQKTILIKVQDPGFYHHHGIDLSTPGGGLTTITQAIVKKLYFEKFAPGIGKIKQSIIARFVVDGLVAKEDQLTIFLNSMYFGKISNRPMIGLATASRGYYQQPVSRLTEDQYISLIAMIVMPGTFHVLNHPEWNKDRVNRIKALVDGEYVPKGLMDQFYGDLPKEVIESGLPPASYFGDSK
jgi:membrane peptidoglycan carboxypeptidase